MLPLILMLNISLKQEYSCRMPAHIIDRPCEVLFADANGQIRLDVIESGINSFSYSGFDGKLRGATICR